MRNRFGTVTKEGVNSHKRIEGTILAPWDKHPT